MDKDKIKIGIIGAGNIGLVFATMLDDAGYDVELVSKRANLIKIDNGSVCDICGDFGTKSALVPTIVSAEEFTCKKDIIIIASKSYFATEESKKALPYLNKNGAIVTIQNIFNIDECQNVIPPSNSVCAFLDFSCVEQKCTINVVDNAGITLGIYDQNAYDILVVVADVFSSICNVNITNDIWGFVLGRNVINTAISSLGAISGMRLGEILEDRKGRFLFVKIIEEAISAINCIDVNVMPYNNQLDYYKFIEHTISGKMYRQKIIGLLRKYNKFVQSSALKDLENNRPTELTFVLNKLAKFAEKQNVQLEYCNIILQMIKEIESGKRRIDRNAFCDPLFAKKGDKNDNRRNQKSQCTSD